MDNKMNKLKERYQEVEMPKDFDEYIRRGIEEGRIQLKNKKRRSGWIRGLASAAAVFAVFVISINTIPVFAKSMAGIPVVGSLVKVLEFNKDTAHMEEVSIVPILDARLEFNKETASGGTITDGADVYSIISQKDETSETITINVSNSDETTDKVPHFKVDYNKYPYTMTFSISGARHLSASKHFDALKQNKFISDIYLASALDDSMVRFTLVFNTNVKFEVKEYKEPAQIVVKLTKDYEVKQQPIYAVRTASYPSGEKIGHLEEILGFGTVRILKDENGTALVQVGTFDSEKLAKEKLEELKKTFGSDIKLFIEKRNPVDIPKVINE